MKTYDTAEKVSVCHWKNGQKVLRDDTVAEEVPVALVYNGISHAVMLATPADLEDFALGFSLTEGIIEVPEEIYGTEIVEVENGIRVEMDIASERFQYLKERRRNLTGRTGCGLCGTDSPVSGGPHASSCHVESSFQYGSHPLGFEKMVSSSFSRKRQVQPMLRHGWTPMAMSGWFGKMSGGIMHWTS